MFIIYIYISIYNIREILIDDIDVVIIVMMMTTTTTVIMMMTMINILTITSSNRCLQSMDSCRGLLKYS